MKRLRCLVICLVCLLVSRLTAEPGFRFPRGTPESQGVSSGALLDFIEAAEARVNALHSFMLVRRGQVIAEGWWSPYAAGEPHTMFSLSKSFTSTAVGLAVHEGKLSIDDLILKFFPEDAPAQPSANLRAMRVRDLLTMAAGHHNEDIQTFPYMSEESLVKKFLALPVPHKPGTFFVYNTPASYMLSAIVQKVTGQTVLDYLKPRLFEPLGIENPKWETSKQGVSLGGFGLHLRTEDIARFGQLYLQRGKWQGKQLVPESWVDQATARWQSNGSSPASDWEQGYGFQFWRCRHGVYRGDGAHGQFCVVLPQFDAVIAITAGTRDLQGVLNVVWEKLLPALQAQALPEAKETHARLQQKLQGLTLKAPKTVVTPALASSVAGRRYVFPQNNQGIESMTLSPSATDPKAVELKMRFAGSDQAIALVPGSWQKGDFTIGPTTEAVAASGGWTSEETFSLELVRYRTPFSTRHNLRFSGNDLILESEPNVGPGSGRPMSVTGKRE